MTCDIPVEIQACTRTREDKLYVGAGQILLTFLALFFSFFRELSFLIQGLKSMFYLDGVRKHTFLVLSKGKIEGCIFLLKIYVALIRLKLLIRPENELFFFYSIKVETEILRLSIAKI